MMMSNRGGHAKDEAVLFYRKTHKYGLNDGNICGG